MARKEEFEYAHDWEEQVHKEQLRAKRQRIALISVLVVAAVAMAAILIAVLVQDRSPDLTGAGPIKPLASGTGTGEAGEGEGEDGDPEDPGEIDVSPLFPSDLVEADLRKVALGEEVNFRVLVTIYGNQIQDEGVREGLRRVFAAIKGEKPDEAYRIAETMKAPARMRQAMRAVALTRLLRRGEAGEAFSLADSENQPPEFNFEYGIYYLGASDMKSAYVQFATGTRKNNRHAPLQFAAAQAAFELGEWEAVIRHADTGVANAEETPENVVLVAASAEERTGGSAAAIERCRKYLEEKSDAHLVKLFLARVLGARGRLPESLEVYGELQEEQPDSQLVQVEKVRAHLASQDYEGAVSLAAQVAAQNQDDVRLQAWYADVLAAAGQSERAGKILEDLSGDLKGNERAVLESIVKVRANDLEGAGKALEPYHTLDPELAIRWAGLKFRQGLAEGDVRDVLSTHQLNAVQWNHLATAAGTSGLWNMAAFAFDEAVKAGDGSHITLNNWAWASLQDSKGFDYEKVERVCQRALAVSPDNPSILHTWGLAMLKSGQPGRCAQMLVERSVITQSSPDLSLIHGQAYTALRANPSARKALQRCLALMESASQWNLDLSREEIEELIASLRD